MARCKGPRESQRSFAGLTFAWRTQATDFGRRGPTVRSMTFASRNVRARSRRFLSRAEHPRQKASRAGRSYSRGESRAPGRGQWRAVRPEAAPIGEPRGSRRAHERLRRARRIRQPAACAPRADWTLPIARRGDDRGNVRWTAGQEPADRSRGRWSRHPRRPSRDRPARRQRRRTEWQSSRSPSTFL
jgi:hypothetical protein